MKAATNGNKEIYQMLMEKGADTQLKDNRGFTAEMLGQIYYKQQGISTFLKDESNKMDQEMKD